MGNHRDQHERSSRRELRARFTAGAVVLALMLAACTSSDTAGPASEPAVTSPSFDSVEAETTTTTTSTTTSTSTTTTTRPPVVNTVESGTSEPAAETTVAPDPLPVPTNTMFDPTTPSGEVEQAVLANLNAFSECLEQLPNCDPQTALRFAAFDYAEGNAELIADWNADGLEIRNLDSWIYEVANVEFSDDGVEAIVFTCGFDGSQLIKPATETSGEEVVDAGDVSTKSKYLLLKIGEAWTVTAKETIETVDGNVAGYCE